MTARDVVVSQLMDGIYKTYRTYGTDGLGGGDYLTAGGLRYHKAIPNAAWRRGTRGVSFPAAARSARFTPNMSRRSPECGPEGHGAAKQCNFR